MAQPPPHTPPVQVNQWSVPLLSNCFDNVGLCLITYNAPCVTYAHNVQRLHQMQDKDCIISGCLYMVPGIDCYMGTVTRGEIREAQAIEGTVVNDAITFLFCNCCALMQESAELDAMERSQRSVPPANPYPVTTQPTSSNMDVDMLTPATEETPYDPTEDLPDSGAGQQPPVTPTEVDLSEYQPPHKY